jgi:hypothetical protein
VMLGFDSDDSSGTRRAIHDLVGSPDVGVVPRAELLSMEFGSRDTWLVTHWLTAHAAQVAADFGSIDRRRVVYLIQDYEPGFSAWSTDYVLSASTYHAGFIPLVNSIPLWSYLRERESLEIDRSLVFAPGLVAHELEQTAARRTAPPPVKVLFYGRPSKPRNLYKLVVAALRATVAALADDDPPVQFFSAGEHHESVDLGGGHTMTNLGILGRDEYFEVLSSMHVLLSLQASPHPSHPPIEAAISGAIAITNEFQQTRSKLHPRLVAVAPDARSLAEAVCAAIRKSAIGPVGGYQPIKGDVLGGSLDEALSAAISRLTSL